MTVEKTIHIEAAPEVVWTVTEDVERWPEWTPTVTSVTRVEGGPFGLGSVARIKQPGQPASEWTVTAFARGRRFAWETRRRGLRMTGTHELSPDRGGTTNVLRVEAKGIVAVLLWPLLRPLVRRALSAENHGLKARCEEIARAASAPR
jgi:uncharacterized membrane protein